MADIRASLDPLLFKWLEYRVTYYNIGTLCTMRPEMQQHLEGASSDTGTKKKTFPSLHESVHSSSDKEKRKSIITTEKSKTVQNDETQKKHDSKSTGERQVFYDHLIMYGIKLQVIVKNVEYFFYSNFCTY